MRAVHLTVIPDYRETLDLTEQMLVRAKNRAASDLHNIVVMRSTAAYQRRQAEQRQNGHEPERGA